MTDPPDAARQAEDNAIAERARTHPAAFAPLYRRYVGPIYGYCYQRLGTRELAEDATSLTFEKAIAGLPKYRSQSFRSWLYAIARNVIIDHHRRKPTEPISDEWELPDPGQSPERTAIEADAERQVRQLLANLSPDQRDVVELDLAGLTGPEIAEALGKSLGAIRAIRFRAYSRLRELLEEETDR
ncbi:MAG: RNA polymerase sigma factor [Thermomicrobiales bacterium]|nr:RNA polymerase sigma factor [Thermomicrobiales bacterium]